MPRTDLPESLRRLVEKEPGAHPEVVYRRLHNQGRLTASVHGSHVRVTVSLRTWWARLMDWTPTDAQLRQIERVWRRTASAASLWLNVLTICSAVYLLLVIGQAFLPGGAVERVLGGIHGH